MTRISENGDSEKYFNYTSGEDCKDTYYEREINADCKMLVEMAAIKQENETMGEECQAYNIEIKVGIRTTLPTTDKTIDVQGRFYQKGNPNRLSQNQ